MVKRLIELKQFLIDMANPRVSLTKDKWISIEKLEVLLRYPYILTKKFQGEDLTSGMFLKEWKNLEFRMSQSGCLIAEGITNSMKRREALLLGNKVLLASIYIDPMHRILLNDDQLSNGRNTLLEVAYRLKGLTASKTEKETVKENHLKVTYSDKDMDIDY